MGKVYGIAARLKAAIRNELQELLGRHLPRRWARMLAETAAAVSPPVGA